MNSLLFTKNNYCKKYVLTLIKLHIPLKEVQFKSIELKKIQEIIFDTPLLFTRKKSREQKKNSKENYSGKCWHVFPSGSNLFKFSRKIFQCCHLDIFMSIAMQNPCRILLFALNWNLTSQKTHRMNDHL